MELIEGVRLALQSLWANKMRSVLTLLGVVIGVASVIMVVTLTNGAKEFVTTKINTYGADVVTISKMPQTFITIDEYLEFQKRRDISLDDYRAVVSACRSCVSVGARRNATGSVVYGNHSSTDTDIRGWTWTMPTLSNLNIELGRAFTEVEDAHSSHVAIVGSDIVDNLLGPGDPLGKEIRVDGSPYTVIGVGERQGKTLGQSMDNWVAVPLTAFLQSHGSHSTLDIYVDAGGGGEVMDAVSDELRTIMRIRRHLAPNAIDTFTIDTSATFQNLLGKILNSFGAVVAAVTARRNARPGWRAPVPVICCGNVTVGGAGKTTLALDLAGRLRARDVAVHILLRGYGGTASGVHRGVPREPYRGVPRGPYCGMPRGPYRVAPGDPASLVGDEALLLAEVAPTWIGPDRAASARAAVAAGAQALVLDDGLQNPTLIKDLSLLVVDGGSGFGGSSGTGAGAGALRGGGADRHG